MQASEAKNDYPVKPINHIVPWPPGGDTDLVARSWAGYAEKILGQPVIVINKVGGGGVAGTTFAAKAKPDGYTLIQASPGGNLVAPQLARPDYNLDSFTPVCLITASPYGIAVNINSPWKTLDDFVQSAKKNPGKFLFGSAGAATSNTLVATHWIRQSGIELKYIHHQGAAPATTALLGGHVDIALLAPQSFIPQLKSKKVRLLVVGAPLDDYPEVPTFDKLGYKGYFIGWSGIFAPRGTPKYVIKKLADTTKEIMKDPAFIKILKNINATPSYMGPEEWQNALKQQYIDIGKVIDEMGLRKK